MNSNLNTNSKRTTILISLFIALFSVCAIFLYGIFINNHNHAFAEDDTIVGESAIPVNLLYVTQYHPSGWSIVAGTAQLTYNLDTKNSQIWEQEFIISVDGKGVVKNWIYLDGKRTLADEWISNGVEIKTIDYLNHSENIRLIPIDFFDNVEKTYRSQNTESESERGIVFHPMQMLLNTALKDYLFPNALLIQKQTDIQYMKDDKQAGRPAWVLLQDKDRRYWVDQETGIITRAELLSTDLSQVQDLLEITKLELLNRFPVDIENLFQDR
ncbi:MAG TPA: hypothetical protein PK299_03190 [Anaerolineales bacterium]|nr:hypothetical protein [Anaerolineales bacterium]